MQKFKLFSLLSIVLSVALLIPGLFLPILHMELKSQVQSSVGSFEATALDKTRSILGTVKDLHEDQRSFVAFLILLFSVIVPFIKIVLLLVSLFSQEEKAKIRTFNMVNTIGKWSMADVFVVAVFIAFLSTTGQGTEKMFDVSVMGMVVPVNLKSTFISVIGPGFYFFLAYCLVSIASLHLIRYSLDQDTGK